MEPTLTHSALHRQRNSQALAYPLANPLTTTTSCSQPKSRLIAYYCRQYAVELALPHLKTAKDPASKSTLLAIMSSLETEKAAVGDAFTKVEAYAVTRDFSNGVLRQADRSYAAVYALNVRDYGKAKGVARSYYAAGVFFDVLGLFETSGVDEAVLEKELIEQRRKYCKWRAALILNAAKKGEDLPEPVADEEEEGEDDDAMEEDDEETKGGETKTDGDGKVRVENAYRTSTPTSWTLSF